MTTKPKTEPAEAPEVEPEAPSSPLVETALGGATLDELRETSVIVPEIARSIDFHGTPVAAQVLREVLGEIERACTEASRRKPNNRKGELRHVDLSTLRQLAALCRVWLPDVGMITSPREQPEHEELRAAAAPEAIVPVSAQPVSPATTPEASAERAAAVAEFERQLSAERIEPSPNGHHELPAVHVPDPWIEPEVWDAAAVAIPSVHLASEVTEGK